MFGLNYFGKIMVSIIAALVIIGLTAKLVGEERKAIWFHKRTKYSWFNRRGPFGELLHFGYPCTIEGYALTIVMFALCAAAIYLIVTFF